MNKLKSQCGMKITEMILSSDFIECNIDLLVSNQINAKFEVPNRISTSTESIQHILQYIKSI